MLDRTGGTVFVFPGFGAHLLAAAAETMDTATVFAEEMRRCHHAFTEWTDWSLLGTVRRYREGPDPVAASDTAGPARVTPAPPVVFATTVSLAAQLRATGVRPDAVLGHSQGELAAAYVAGALSLRDAARVLAQRSRALAPNAGTGAMAALSLPSCRVHRLVEPWRDAISVAAQNGPCTTVVTGSATALAELSVECGRRDIAYSPLDVDLALHSAAVDELREPIRDGLCDLHPVTGELAFVSSVTGAGLDARILDGDYWFANMRQPVLFEQAVRWSYGSGYRTFVECSPRAVLATAVRECLHDRGDVQGVFTADRRGRLVPVARAAAQA